MNLSRALDELEKGKLIRRDSWPDKVHIYKVSGVVHRYRGERVQYPDFMVMALPTTNKGLKHQPGWTPTQEDLFAHDWDIHEQKETCSTFATH